MRNPGSGQPPAAEGEGEWAARNPSHWGREKERGSATTVGGKGQGNSARPRRQRVRRPFPLAPNQAPTSACMSAPATSTCARGMGVAHMGVASVVGGAGQTGGGGGGEGDSGDGALCVLPHPPCSRLRKKKSLVYVNQIILLIYVFLF